MTTPDPAKARFFMLMLVRLGGAIATGLGLVLALTPRIGGQPQPLTGAIVGLIGFLLLIVAPVFLLRSWRTPK